MLKWQELKIEGIAKIEKFVSEFDVYELEKTPYSKFKVKVFESSNGTFTGYTNLRIKDETGDACGGVGYGSTIEETLKDTIIYFMHLLSEKDDWTENDFVCSDSFDF